MLRIVHLSDSHVGKDPAFEFGGAPTLKRLRAVVAKIGELEPAPDLVIHTGDVVDEPSKEAYLRAAEALKPLVAPVYYACGNHDGATLLEEILPMGPRQPVPGAGSSMTYVVDAGGHELLVIDACASGRDDGRGLILPEQWEAIAAAVAALKGAFAVFVHFPPLPLDCPWVDREMLLLEGERFHEFFAALGPERVRGIFFGHLHHGVQLSRDGLSYVGVRSACCRIRNGPEDDEAILEPEAPVGFNLITLEDKATLVRDVAFEVK